MTNSSNTQNAFSPGRVSAGLTEPGFVPSLNEKMMRAISDEECVTRLASVVSVHDDRSLGEVVMLISRLAVTIE